MSMLPHQETIKCGYCSATLKRKNLKEHTANVHGRGVQVKEKVSSNQPLLSDHFSAKRKDDGCDNVEPEANNPKIDEDEALLMEDEEYDIEDNLKEVFIKVVKENKDELKQDIIEAKEYILSAIEHMNENKKKTETNDELDYDILNNAKNIENV